MKRVGSSVQHAVLEYALETRALAPQAFGCEAAGVGATEAGGDVSDPSDGEDEEKGSERVVSDVVSSEAGAGTLAGTVTLDVDDGSANRGSACDVPVRAVDDAAAFLRAASLYNAPSVYSIDLQQRVPPFALHSTMAEVLRYLKQYSPRLTPSVFAAGEQHPTTGSSCANTRLTPVGVGEDLQVDLPTWSITSATQAGPKLVVLAGVLLPVTGVNDSRSVSGDDPGAGRSAEHGRTRSSTSSVSRAASLLSGTLPSTTSAGMEQPVTMVARSSSEKLHRHPPVVAGKTTSRRLPQPFVPSKYLLHAHVRASDSHPVFALASTLRGRGGTSTGTTTGAPESDPAPAGSPTSASALGAAGSTEAGTANATAARRGSATTRGSGSGTMWYRHAYVSLEVDCDGIRGYLYNWAPSLCEEFGAKVARSLSWIRMRSHVLDACLLTKLGLNHHVEGATQRVAKPPTWAAIATTRTSFRRARRNAGRAATEAPHFRALVGGGGDAHIRGRHRHHHHHHRHTHGTHVTAAMGGRGGGGDDQVLRLHLDNIGYLVTHATPSTPSSSRVTTGGTGSSARYQSAATATDRLARFPQQDNAMLALAMARRRAVGARRMPSMRSGLSSPMPPSRSVSSRAVLSKDPSKAGKVSRASKEPRSGSMTGPGSGDRGDAGDSAGAIATTTTTTTSNQGRKTSASDAGSSKNARRRTSSRDVALHVSGDNLSPDGVFGTSPGSDSFLEARIAANANANSHGGHGHGHGHGHTSRWNGAGGVTARGSSSHATPLSPSRATPRTGVSASSPVASSAKTPHASPATRGSTPPRQLQTLTPAMAQASGAGRPRSGNNVQPLNSTLGLAVYNRLLRIDGTELVRAADPVAYHGAQLQAADKKAAAYDAQCQRLLRVVRAPPADVQKVMSESRSITQPLIDEVVGMCQCIGVSRLPFLPRVWHTDQRRRFITKRTGITSTPAGDLELQHMFLHDYIGYLSSVLGMRKLYLNYSPMDHNYGRAGAGAGAGAVAGAGADSDAGAGAGAGAGDAAGAKRGSKAGDGGPSGVSSTSRPPPSGPVAGVLPMAVRGSQRRGARLTRSPVRTVSSRASRRGGRSRDEPPARKAYVRGCWVVMWWIWVLVA